MGRHPLSGHKGCKVHVSGILRPDCRDCNSQVKNQINNRKKSLISKAAELRDLASLRACVVIFQTKEGHYEGASLGPRKRTHKMLKNLVKNRIFSKKGLPPTMIGRFPDAATLEETCFKVKHGANKRSLDNEKAEAAEEEERKQVASLDDASDKKPRKKKDQPEVVIHVMSEIQFNWNTNSYSLLKNLSSQ